MTATLYDIRLRIVQTYAVPAGPSRHLIRVMPAERPGRQSLLAGHLRVSPGATERSDQTDFFGNATTNVLHTAPHDSLEITLRARVACQAQPAELDIAPPLAGLPAELAGLTALDPGSPQHYLGASPRIAPDAAIEAHARACVSEGMNVRDILEAVGRALHRDLTFDAEATSVDTPAARAFAERRGVCQDFTHIMITGLRAMGIPAGYVSGYLRTKPPPGQPRLEGADAMHAWVRGWCGTELGWVEYDPTNATFTATDHIVAAVGRDYDDIAPVRGVLRASGGNVGLQAVDVIPVTGATVSLP